MTLDKLREIACRASLDKDIFEFWQSHNTPSDPIERVEMDIRYSLAKAKCETSQREYHLALAEYIKQSEV